jgi:predicted transcriptional regulator
MGLQFPQSHEKEKDLSNSNYPLSPGHVPDNDTSIAAADSVAVTAPTIRGKILKHIASVGKVTCDEIEVVFGLRHQTASARVRELSMLGEIVDTGERRKTRSGRTARVYELYAA